MRAIYLAVLVSVLAPILSAAPASCSIGRSVPTFKSCDSRWGDIHIMDRWRDTMCSLSQGSNFCAIASGIASLGKTIRGQKADPKSFHEYYKSVSVDFQRYDFTFDWEVITDMGYKFTCKSDKIEALKNAICNKHIVLLSIYPGYLSGYHVLATGYNGDVFTVMDPQEGRTTYTAKEIYSGTCFN